MVPKGKLLRKVTEKYFKGRYRRARVIQVVSQFVPKCSTVTVLEWKLQMSATDRQWNLSVFSY